MGTGSTGRWAVVPVAARLGRWAVVPVAARLAGLGPDNADAGAPELADRCELSLAPLPSRDRDRDACVLDE